MGKTIRDVQVTVPVLGSDPVKIQTRFSKPLMPCHPARARQLLKKGAKARWFKGIYAIQLKDRSEGNVQPVVCGIDPGSKREAFTVQSKEHTYLNVLSDAICHVSCKVEDRKMMRRSRRRRKTPHRAPRSNRCVGGWLAPSIVSRWEAKLRIINFLRKLYPITSFAIEDVAAKKRPGQRRWNKNFSDIEMGKTLYYEKISKLGDLKLFKGYDTALRREVLGLKKAHSKLSESFDSHNVDSWVLASFITGRDVVDNKNVFRMMSHNFYRRMLHHKCPSKKGIRNRYGGTMCGGFKKGSVVRHPKYGLLYVGGFSRGINLYNISTGDGERYYNDPKEYIFLYHSGWRTNWVNHIIVNPKTEFIGGHSLRDPTVRAKGNETKQKLYGDPNFTNREQAMETCLKRYGVDNVAKIKSVNEKRNKTMIAKYGKIFNYERPDTFTKEELIELHINQKLTLNQIAEKYDMNSSTVSFWLNKHGISVQRHLKHYDYSPSEIIYTRKQKCSEGDFIKAMDLLKSLSKERGMVRGNYSDGALGLSTSILEKKYGTWNNFVKLCGLKPEREINSPVDHVKDYLKVCLEQNSVVSFSNYEKLTKKPCTRLKRLFNAGKPYAHLKEELFQIALKPELWDDFLKKFV